MIKLTILILISLASVSCSEYNKSQSIQFAYLSSIIYCQQDNIQNWNCSLCKKLPYYKNISYIQNKNLHIVGFIAYDSLKNRIILTWRGTIDIRNLFQDFNFQKINYKCKGCQIHAGFYQSYKSVEKIVKGKVQNLIKQYPNALIYVTGHSLGGALATICALQLQLVYNKVIELHNFGAPRIGNDNLAQFIKLKIPNKYRIVHYKDMAPHLPPESLEYKQPPFEILYDQQMNNYKQCNESGQDKSCSNSYSPNYNWDDHHHYWVGMYCQV